MRPVPPGQHDCKILLSVGSALREQKECARRLPFLLSVVGRSRRVLPLVGFQLAPSLLLGAQLLRQLWQLRGLQAFEGFLGVSLWLGAPLLCFLLGARCRSLRYYLRPELSQARRGRRPSLNAGRRHTQTGSSVQIKSCSKVLGASPPAQFTLAWWRQWRF